MRTDITTRRFKMYSWSDRESDISTIYLRYDSWPEFVQDATTCPKGPAGYRYSHSNSRSNSRFSGEITWNQAVDLARNGWKDGSDRIKALLAPLYDKLAREAYQPEMVMDIEGDTIDIGTLLTGFPEPFLRWQDSQQLVERGNSNRHVRIGYNISASGGFSTEDLFTKGAYICALVDMLETHGRRVSLDLYDGTRSGERRLYVRIELKKADAPLNLRNIAFAVCHPATLRRLLFSKEESLPYPWYNLTYCMPDDPPDLEADIKINATTLIQAGFDMTAWVKGHLVAQGVEFKD